MAGALKVRIGRFGASSNRERGIPSQIQKNKIHFPDGSLLDEKIVLAKFVLQQHPKGRDVLHFPMNMLLLSNIIHGKCSLFSLVERRKF